MWEATPTRTAHAHYTATGASRIDRIYVTHARPNEEATLCGDGGRRLHTPFCSNTALDHGRTLLLYMKREDQQDATIRCLLLTSVSTCSGHHYAHLQENKGRVTACGVLRWFCWMWLVAVVGRCVVGCEHCSHPTKQRPTTATNHIQQNQNNTPNAVTGPLFS